MYNMSGGWEWEGGGELNHLPLVFCKSVYKCFVSWQYCFQVGARYPKTFRTKETAGVILNFY